MSADQIQQARDVLAEWRTEAASPLPWKLDEESGAVDGRGVGIVGLASREDSAIAYLFPGDDRLIVGTAGNPELLDEISRTLLYAQYEDAPAVLVNLGRNLAAAIIAADERMSA